jgi:hypothetical protein
MPPAKPPHNKSGRGNPAPTVVDCGIFIYILLKKISLNVRIQIGRKGIFFKFEGEVWRMKIKITKTGFVLLTGKSL